MLARVAQGNCSIFRSQGLFDLETVILEYLKYAVIYDNSPSNTKYCIQNMLKELQETPRGKRFLECQTLEQIWYDILQNAFKFIVIALACPPSVQILCRSGCCKRFHNIYFLSIFVMTFQFCVLLVVIVTFISNRIMGSFSVRFGIWASIAETNV